MKLFKRITRIVTGIQEERIQRAEEKRMRHEWEDAQFEAFKAQFDDWDAVCRAYGEYLRTPIYEQIDYKAVLKELGKYPPKKLRDRKPIKPLFEIIQRVL